MTMALTTASEIADYFIWEETTEQCFGIPNEKQLVDTPYQLFEISLNQGRVHGFFIENIIYIVWLDPEHKLYQ